MTKTETRKRENYSLRKFKTIKPGIDEIEGTISLYQEAKWGGKFDQRLNHSLFTFFFFLNRTKSDRDIE